ncbi:cytochrome P450 [Bacillus pakistanensis]|uniref:Cytochrome P450 n=1 Tax=Rossellomorea pakistanensis TaxID=992288 RepID=A0ABS2NBF0_9BACI|nr:cytochrome P450 [Bacillus pakistanensis]MBM7585171.1 cytochrome P450 [Bacillus pakistanensis]
MSIKVKKLSSISPLGQLGKFKENPLAFLDELKETDSDIAQFRIANRKVHLVMNPDFIKDILETRAAGYRQSSKFDELKPLLGEGLITSEDPKHKEQRKKMAPLFTKEHMKSYRLKMIGTSEQFYSQQREGEWNLSDVMMELSLACLSRTILGMDLAETKEKIGAPLYQILEVGTKRIQSLLKAPLSFKVGEIKAYASAIDELNKTVDEVILVRNEKNYSPYDFLKMLLEACEGNRLQARNEIMTMLLSGHETTANWITWCLYAICQNEDVKQNLYREVDHVAGRNKLTPAMLERLTYSKKVLNESLRLYPPQWMLGRTAVNDLTYGGYTIQKGDIALLSPYVMHRHPKFYPDPLKFKPERFQEGIPKDVPDFAFFPFGGGARGCIGNHFAFQEALIILSMFIQKFDIQLVDENRIVPEPFITLRVKDGLRGEVWKR